jgi:hypothetical protein
MAGFQNVYVKSRNLVLIFHGFHHFLPPPQISTLHEYFFLTHVTGLHRSFLPADRYFYRLLNLEDNVADIAALIRFYEGKMWSGDKSTHSWDPHDFSKCKSTHVALNTCFKHSELYLEMETPVTAIHVQAVTLN